MKAPDLSGVDALLERVDSIIEESSPGYAQRARERRAELDEMISRIDPSKLSAAPIGPTCPPIDYVKIAGEEWGQRTIGGPDVDGLPPRLYFREGALYVGEARLNDRTFKTRANDLRLAEGDLLVQMSRYLRGV